jgi:hypothetical protein
MNCPFCGKAIQTAEATCPHCGNSVAQSSSVSAQGPTRPGQHSQDRELEELLRHTPSVVGAGARLVAMFVFGLVLVGLVVFFFIMSAKRRDAPPIFQVFFVIVGLGGLAMVVGAVRGFAKLSRSPLLRVPAAVVAKRQKSSGGRYSQEVCLLTVQTEDGPRKEYPVSDTLFGEVEEGDTGVAYFKGGYLLDFRRLRVAEAPVDEVQSQDA